MLHISGDATEFYCSSYSKLLPLCVCMCESGGGGVLLEPDSIMLPCRRLGGVGLDKISSLLSEPFLTSPSSAQHNFKNVAYGLIYYL